MLGMIDAHAHMTVSTVPLALFLSADSNYTMTHPRLPASAANSSISEPGIWHAQTDPNPADHDQDNCN